MGAYPSFRADTGIGPGVTVEVGLQLTNPGPLDDMLYPGIIVTGDATQWTAADGTSRVTNAVYALRAGETTWIGARVTLSPTLGPCSQALFHMQVRSFGGDADSCAGANVEFGIMLPNPDGKNCPGCPATAPKGQTACTVAGLDCSFMGNPPSCICNDGRWTCFVNIH